MRRANQRRYQAGSDIVLLLSFTKGHVSITEITESDLPNITLSTQSFDRDVAWEQVVGVAITQSTESVPIQWHYVSGLSLGTEGSSNMFTFTLGQTPAPSDAKWARSITQQKSLLALQHNLGTRVVARVTGLAASSSGYYTASCFSLHPSELLQYAIETTQRSVIVVAREHSEAVYTVDQAPPACKPVQGMLHYSPHLPNFANKFETYH